MKKHRVDQLEDHLSVSRKLVKDYSLLWKDTGIDLILYRHVTDERTSK